MRQREHDGPNDRETDPQHPPAWDSGDRTTSPRKHHLLSPQSTRCG
jgi:hypothetical protein